MCASKTTSFTPRGGGGSFCRRLFVAINRTFKFAYAQLPGTADKMTVAQFVRI